jgi:hypothetical protein
MTMHDRSDASAAPDDPYAFVADRVAEDRRLV